MKLPAEVHGPLGALETMCVIKAGELDDRAAERARTGHLAAATELAGLACSYRIRAAQARAAIDASLAATVSARAA